MCIVLASSRLWSASKHVSNVPGREFIVCASSLTLSFEVLSGLGTVVGRSLRKPFDHITVEVAYSGQRLWFMQCKPVSDSALHHLPAGLYVIKSWNSPEGARSGSDCHENLVSMLGERYVIELEIGNKSTRR